MFFRLIYVKPCLTIKHSGPHCEVQELVNTAVGVIAGSVLALIKPGV